MTFEARIDTADTEPALVWRLWREDTNGNQYRMPLEFSSEEEIIEAHALYTEKGHHQTYSMRQMDPEDTTTFIPATDM
jgi:hypothetical protein